MKITLNLSPPNRKKLEEIAEKKPHLISYKVNGNGSAFADVEIEIPEMENFIIFLLMNLKEIKR